MSKTSIEWTEETWNPVAGCTWASAGCDHCYAAGMTRRLEAMGKVDYAGLTTKKHFNGQVRTLPHKLDAPLRRRKPTMWFVNSMSDLFHKDVPFEFIDRVFAVMALCPQHTFQVLTKRPERMAEYCDDPIRRGWMIGEATKLLGKKFPLTPGPFGREERWQYPLSNVWLGTSVENQEQADQRIPWLLKTPAAVRFLSCEPLLSEVDLRRGTSLDGIGWVIVGCESGHHRRSMNLDWSRKLVEQCRCANSACFVKQVEVDGRVSGNVDEFPSDHRVREMPSVEKGER